MYRYINEIAKQEAAEDYYNDLRAWIAGLSEEDRELYEIGDLQYNPFE